MNKKQFLLLTLTLLSMNGFAQVFEWAKRMGGTGGDAGQSITVDAAGNVYSTGAFYGIVDFDPGAGVYNLTSGGGSDIFVSKLDALGNFVWAKRMGGTGFDGGHSIAVDAAGSIYTTGNYLSTADFDPGASIYNLTSVQASDIFVSKLDASGNFVWAKSLGGSGDEQGKAIAVDPSGNVYTTGYFYDISDFDPGSLVYNLTSVYYNSDIFISKLDASGAFVWAIQFGEGSFDISYSIAVDAASNVYTTGYFQGTVDFDPGAGNYNLTSGGGGDIFISKLDASGSFIWAKQMVGVNYEYGYAITCDASGYVYTTGSFTDTVDFDPGPGVYNLNSAGGNNIFISKLDASGNFVWAKSMGGSNTNGFSIALDPSANVYTTGYFNGTNDFDPDGGIYNLTSAGNDIFISKLDASGNFVWAVSMGGTSNEISYAIAVDASENVYASGYFNGTADFDPGAAIYNMTSAGSNDIFVVKLSLDILPITLLNFEAAINDNDVYLTWQTATESNTDKFEIERSIEGRDYQYIGEVEASENSVTIKSYDFSDINAGINFPNQYLYYRFKQLDIDGKYTYSPIRAVNFNNNLSIQLYPTLVEDIFTIQVNADFVGFIYSVSDEAGRQVLSGILNSPSTSVDISHLSSGIYFVQAGNLVKESVKIVKE
jgi:uncharacterized protein (DUF2249 family)